MKRKKSSKYFLYPVFASIVVAGLYFLIKSDSKEEATEEKEPLSQVEKEKPTIKLVDTSLFEEKSYKEPTKYTTFKVFYPHFRNTPKEFNQRIEDLVLDGIENHKKDSEEGWRARYETKSLGDKITEFPKEDEKFYYEVSFKPTQVNDNFVSFLLTVSGYTGGAHGYQNLTSFGYDVARKKEIALEDLFPSDSNYLKTVSEFSRKNLEAQFRKSLNIVTKEDEANFKDSVMPMLLEGTTPKEENFSVFTFTKEAITFYFNQYQVGPYAMGEPRVIMPRK